MSDAGTEEQQRAMRLGLACTRTAMLTGNDDDVLAKVEIERRLVLQTTRDFNRAIATARAAGFAWEQIVEHVPGLAKSYGADAAEKLFDLVAAPGSRLGERYVSWRCGDCEGLVLDYGPYGGHPADAEPGHHEDCGRLARIVTTYLAEPEADDQLPAGIDQDVSDGGNGWSPRARPIELQGPGPDL